MHHYYLVDRRSETHKIIEQSVAKCVKGTKARWAFIGRLFPESKKKNSEWKLVTWGSSNHWGIQPRSQSGTITIPDDWKFMRNSTVIIPRHSTKGGKALHKEMESDKYCVPSAGDIGLAIGIKAVFNGMSLCTPGFITLPDGRYVIEGGEKCQVNSSPRRSAFRSRCMAWLSTCRSVVPI
jgi:hypothetical protein